MGEMTKIHYFFEPKKEAKKPEDVTLRKLEKMCGKHVEMSIFTSYFRTYEGDIEKTGAGYLFRGDDGAVTQRGEMIKILRNTDFNSVEIEVLGPSSGGH